MITTKTVLVAAMLSSLATLSLAQAPATKPADHPTMTGKPADHPTKTAKPADHPTKTAKPADHPTKQAAPAAAAASATK